MKWNRIDVTWTYISNRFNNRGNNELKVEMNRSRIHVTLTYISNGFNNAMEIVMSQEQVDFVEMNGELKWARYVWGLRWYKR